jgi:hypothetical protein
MFSRIRKRTTYANVVMTLALVFAMTGGAYAAKKYLITSTKQISPKVIAALKGRQGPQGPAGLAGEKGAAGANGTNGKDGINGINGQNGANGEKGSTGPVGPKGSTGAQGNQGSTGPTGPTGPTGNIAPPLPVGVTETGTFAVNAEAKPFAGFGGVPLVLEPISFPIQLAAKILSPHVHLIGVSETSTNPAVVNNECSGNSKEPAAASGNVCIFVEIEENVRLTETFAFETSKVGTILFIHPEKEGENLAVAGGWAVTG